jgi:NAD dependent epimerase/dehydratase family enzyme
MSTIAVIFGRHGFIGSHLARKLLEGGDQSPQIRRRFCLALSWWQSRNVPSSYRRGQYESRRQTASNGLSIRTIRVVD